MGTESDGQARPVDCPGQVTRGSAAPHQGLRGASGGPPQSAPLGFQPALELRGPRDEEAFEHVAPIERERLVASVRSDRCIERDDVAPQLIAVEADLFVTARDDHGGAERAPQHVQRLAQRGAGVFLIELGPEQREQAVAAMKASGRGGEVGEQGEASGPAEQAHDFASRGVGQLHGAEQPERDHARPLRLEPAAGVTAGGDATLTRR